MSTAQNDVELPEDDFIEEEAVQKKPAMSPLKKMLIGSATAIAIVGGLMLSVGGGTNEPSSMSRAPNLDSTPGGDQEASPLYQESLRSRNEQLAEMARENGESFMATPEGILTPLDRLNAIDAVRIEEVVAEPEPEPAPLPPRERRILPRPAPAPAPTPVREPEPEPEVEEVVATGEQPPENPYISRMNSMMQATAPLFVARPMMSVTIASSGAEGSASASEQSIVDSASTGSVQPCENCVSDAGSASENNNANLPMLRPGDVLYAETVNSVDSDVPSSVIAEVVAGAYKGARLVGGFQTDPGSGRMMVQFAAMTMADGTTIPITGLAVDGRTAENTVRSDIERRYVKRYGPVLAASFISTYAQAISQPEQRVVNMGDGVEIVTEAPTERQAIAAGVSAGLSNIASDIVQYAPKGPKVTLRDGWPIAVMILAPMEQAVQAQAPVQASAPAAYLQTDEEDADYLLDEETLEALSQLRAQ